MSDAPLPDAGRTPAKVSLRALREQMAARSRDEHEEAEREKWRDLASSALQAMGWAATGIALIAWALHSTSETYGRIAFYSGVAIGNGGWIFTMLAAYRRGEKRGDW